MLVPKGFLGLLGVRRNPQHGGPAFSKCARQPGEVDGLLGAARGVRAGIKKQHQFLAREVAQRNGLAAVTRQPEGGCLYTLGDSGLPDRRRGGFPATACLQAHSRTQALRPWPSLLPSRAARPRLGRAALTVSMAPWALLSGWPCRPVCRLSCRACPTPPCGLSRPAFCRCHRSGASRLPSGDLGDFLRVFLDIRLPFVAFGGSIIRVCGLCPGEFESGGPLGKSDGLGLRLQGIQRSAGPLVECAPWAG